MTPLEKSMPSRRQLRVYLVMLSESSPMRMMSPVAWWMAEISFSSEREISCDEILMRYATMRFSISNTRALSASTCSFFSVSCVMKPSKERRSDCIARSAMCAAAMLAWLTATEGDLMRRSSRAAQSFSGVCAPFFSRMSLVAALTNSCAKGRKMQVQTTLKKVWKRAICKPGSSANQLPRVALIKPGQHSRKMEKMTVPNTLNIRWMSAARLALVLAPTEERSAVTQVPMLVPSTRNSTPLLEGSPMVSPAATICTMRVVTAEEDCTMPVMMTPASNSTRRLSTLMRKSLTMSCWAKSSIAMPMYSRPRNTSPRPASIMPMVLAFSFLHSMSMKMPTQVKRVMISMKGISAMTEK